MGQTPGPNPADVGAVAKNTVWCSAAWNYEYKSLPLATAYPVIGNQGVAASAVSYDKTGTGNDGTGTNILKGDMGFCCYTLDTALSTFSVAENVSATSWSTTKLN